MTIKDIAKESGYSVGTVSRVLNHAPGVSDKARARVMEVVKKNHFRLNNNARYLKKQSMDGIAIIIKGTQNMLFASIVEQLQGLIKKENYDCMVYYIDECDNEVETAIEICNDRRPEGIMFLGSNKDYFTKSFSQIKTPCVLVTSSAEEMGYDNLSSIATNDEEAAEYIMKYLLDLGHRNIGILGGNMDISKGAVDRYQGCMKALEKNGISFDPERQYETGFFSVGDGYRAMENLLNKMPEVTGVFANCDAMAVGAIRAIFDRGLRVPDDISVAGFDGIDIGRYINPRLTTIRQHRESLAVNAVEILLSHIDDPDLPPVHLLEPFHLVNGESAKQVGV